MDRQFRGADFDDVTGCDASRADLTPPIDEDSLAAQRRDPQSAQRSRREYGVLQLDSGGGELQVLAGSAPDREPARVDQNSARFRGGFAK